MEKIYVVDTIRMSQNISKYYETSQNIAQHYATSQNIALLS